MQPVVVPSPPPGLLGRDEALATLARAVAPGALVAVVGPPGVGKSSLVAALTRADALWVDLAPAVTVNDLWAACAGALSLAFGSPEEAHLRLVRALGARRVGCLVFDAAERLDRAAWAALRRLVVDLGAARVVVTSVIRPPLPDAQVLELGALAPAHATALLVERARARSLDRPIDPHSPTWAALAARLDGLPLAIELAAGRLGVLTPEQLLARLDRPEVLAGGRHGSFGGALRYAWSLLSEGDRAALAACSVFRGGFDLAGAEAVLGPDAIERLAALRERSALGGRDGRFHLLEGLRQLAEAEGVGRAEATERHRRYYLELGEALRTASRGPAPRASAQAMLVERDNLRAAFERSVGVDPAGAAALGRVLVASIRIHGPLWLADELGAVPGAARAAGGASGAELLSAWGGLQLARGRLEEARGVLVEALGMAEAAHDDAAASSARSDLGWLHLMMGDFELGRADLARAAALAPDGFLAALALNRLGNLELASREQDAAAEALEDGLRALERAPSLRMEGTLRLNLGTVRAEQGRYAEGQEMLERAVGMLAEIDRSGVLVARINLGLLHLAQGRPAAAAPHLEAALAEQRAYGSALAEGQTLVPTALERWMAGDLVEARRRLGEAIGLLGEADPRSAASARAWRAALDAEAGGAVDLAGELALARAAGADAELVDELGGTVAPGAPHPSLEAAVARRLRSRGPPPLRADADGRWFEVPEGRVDLSRRGALQRILAALVAARRERPGVGLPVEALAAAGWPGERVLPEAASARVYTAVRELRGLGLEPVLKRHADGYRLDPGVPMAVDR